MDPNAPIPDSPFAPGTVELPVRPDRAPTPSVYTLPWWAALSMVPVALIAGAIASSFVAVIAYAVSGGFADGFASSDFQRYTSRMMGTAGGSALLILPQQLTFLLIALAMAWPAGKDWKRQYRLRAPEGRIWHWMCVAVATVGLGMVTSILFSVLATEESEYVRRFDNWFRSQQGFNAVGLLLLISIAPGICEEFFFRGFLLGSLDRRLTPKLAIALTAGAFALVHLHPVHVLLILPVGIWLTIITRVFNSLYIGIFAHFVNNAASVGLALVTGEAESNGNLVTFAVFVVTFPVLLIAIALVMRLSRAQRAARELADVVVATPIIVATSVEDAMPLGDAASADDGSV